jgi:hypothetical protein
MTDKGSRAVKMGGQSFIVDIKCTQNHTWQGNLTWVDRKKKQSFRSTLELIKLIDSAMESVAPYDEEKISW